MTVASPLRTLAGTRIAGFTQFLIGPAACQYLSDLGAEVVKVEQRGVGAWERSWSGGNTFANGVSVFYLLCNRNARSLALDLKKAEGLQIARDLITRSDVLVQNFRPGVMEKLGLGYEDVVKLNPQLIYASSSGYGSDSPYRDKPGQDLIVQALSGLMSVTGRAGEVPVAAGAAIVDQHAAVLLAMAVLAGLLHRDRTGQGQRIEVTMMEAAFDLQLEPLMYYLNGGRIALPRVPLASTFHPAPYGVYPTRDGFLVLSLSPVKALREAIGDAPQLATLEDPQVAMSRREEIYAALAPIMAKKTTVDWVEQLEAKGIWCAPVNDYGALLHDPALTHLDPFMEMQHPKAGRVKALKHPVRYSAGEPELRRVPPDLGQDTDAILEELGYSHEDIEGFRRREII